MEVTMAMFMSPVGQALAFASVAGYLTYHYVGDVANWTGQDVLFVVAVAAVVLMHRYRVKAYIEHDPKQRILDDVVPAYSLEDVEYVQGSPVHLGESRVVAVLFFATWCKGSRAALNEFEKVCSTYGRDVAFVAVTQESKEELAAYEVHGRRATNFKPLSDFSFAIGTENGTLTKEYQLKHKINTLPHVYLIGRDDSIFWHGHPVGHFDDATRRTLAYDFSAASNKIE
ncbi:hypothetical protein, variant 1 [Aphanomyces invadans]|uniref:Thioredoxin domain-containing protein n=1 Tax=Aphanomyces invadans TaxID=157072 RepID=A0A024TGA6_9STRA|nr:hypothetical protein, variant 1 [Aphanomyces invadans]ETV92626.1 hypothetical protein, variant 1 [Aphanomyces invadans]|eukprot:XP_008878661.1 hypothetical protein, variant 1 [Aphanomyces invadans]